LSIQGRSAVLARCEDAIPKRFVGAAVAFDWARRMKGMGIQAENLQINWLELMRFKRSLAKAGIEGFHGRARFIGPSAVQVGNEALEARYFVVAVGQNLRI
jgi:glutathione reductase (NADPH)